MDDPVPIWRDPKEIQMIGTETYSFGEWLKQRRGQLRLTQRELATNAYCSVAMIKKIESDERRPSLELAELLATALKFPKPVQEIFIEVARGERPVDALWLVWDETTTSSLLLYAPVPLPKPATPFVGRTEELTELDERLSHPNCRLLTLVGPGGIGKTRLAIAMAQSQQVAFFESIAFVSLAAITDASLIPDTIARGLRLTLSGPPAEQVMAYLRRRSMLLILDNCEQLDGDLSWLSDLLAAAPGVKLLTTSRERLHLTEEWVYVVPELAQSATLFVDTAQRIKQDFNVEVERLCIVRICELVENLPLAVELAASWIPHMSCAQIADHIQRDINILATDARNVPERHRNIQAVFDHSWNLLTSAEQNALMRLSVFRGGWQAAEALPVAGADVFMLRQLVDKSLVRVGENGRYDLHELIRQYASHRLAQTGLDTETRQRHFDTYLALAARLDAQQFGPDAIVAVNRFGQEHDNIRAALEWGLGVKQTEACLRLLDHLWFYWTRRGFNYEGAEWTSRAIQQAGDHESVYLCMALSNAAVFYSLLGRFAEAELLAHRALAMAPRLENPEALIIAYILHAFASVNAEQALKGLNEGITLIQQTGNRQELLPLYYLGMASWSHSSGRYAEAENHFRQSIVLFRQMGAIDFVAEPLGRLGQLVLQEGRLQEAYDLTLESIAAARTMGFDDVYYAWGRAQLGLIQLYLGEAEAAQRSVEQALLSFDDSREARLKLEALAILSEVMLAQGDVKRAADHMHASLNICRLLYHQLQATPKLDGTPDALPIDIIELCSRASLVAAAQSYYDRAVTLYSIADSLRSQSGQHMIPALRARIDESMTVLRSQLSEDGFATAWNTGQRMSLSEAFAFLLA